MGGQTSRLSAEELAILQKTTHFDKKELRQWYKSFTKSSPSGALTRPEFQKIYRQFFPFGDPSVFANCVFDLLDVNVNNQIEFSEFIEALSKTSRGKLEERIDWTFKLYDVDKDGFISREEMNYVVDAVYKMVGSMMVLSEDEDTPEKRVDKLFQVFDPDGTNRISRSDFQAATKNDPEILKGMSLYGGLI